MSTVSTTSLKMRDTLFGDMPLEKWARQADAEPWTSFVRAREALAAGDRETGAALLLGVTRMPGLESRQCLQAWHALRGLGVTPQAQVAKSILGVVVEVALADGLDLLAAYADHSARYWNHAGSGVVWDAPDAEMDPWIERGDVRLNLLTPAGLCFGEGPFDALAKDAMGGPLIAAATELMRQLVKLPAGRTQP